MTKKDFLIQLFTKIEPYWSVVVGFLAILENENCSPQDIESMYTLIDQYIATITDKNLKEKLIHISSYLKTLQEAEELSKIQDEKEAEELLSLLDTL